MYVETKTASFFICCNPTWRTSDIITIKLELTVIWSQYNDNGNRELSVL